MDKMDKRMIFFMDELLKNHGMATFAQLQKNLEATLTPEEKKQYQQARFPRSQETSSGIDAALSDCPYLHATVTLTDHIEIVAISAITLVSGVTAKTVNIANILRTGHVILTFKDYAKAFITIITKGYEAGKIAFKAASKSAKLAGELPEESSKMAKYASKAARLLKVIAAFGVIADVVLLGYVLYPEKKQTYELRTAITELYVRRIISKFYERLASAVKTQDGMMISYLILVSDSGTIDPDEQRAADKIANKLIGYVQEDWEAIDTKSSLDLLVTFDHMRECLDPSYDEALKQADEFEDNGAAPPANRTVDAVQYTAPTVTEKLAYNGLSGKELEIELEELKKSFAEYLPSSEPSSDGGYTMSIQDIVGIQDIVLQIHKMVDTDMFEKAAIVELFS
ncbi:hypothetical protein JB92DRAFT_3146390 [Gautieria morchelliformis]|nr:hypothetical protein JB92DRAFT_3146390 [Gautieria morchelliformis]